MTTHSKDWIELLIEATLKKSIKDFTHTQGYINKDWIELEALSTRNWERSEPILLNNTQFIICSSASSDKYIHRYNIGENKWDHLMEFPTQFSKRSDVTIAFNKNNKTLYIISDNVLLQLHLSNVTNTHKVYHHDYTIGHSARAKIINNKFHVIQGTKSNLHLCWNEQAEKFDEIFKFERIIKNDILYNCSQFGLIQLTKKNCLLSLGGYNGFDDDMAQMLKYDIKQKKWEFMSERLPQPLSFFGCIKTINEDFVIIFGGTTGGWDEEQLDTIYVLDLKTMQFKISDLVCPKTANYHAINVSDYEKGGLLSFGYIRYIWNCAEFSTMNEFPLELVQLISIFYCLEYAHIIAQNGQHWKIALDEILNSLK